MSTAQRGYATGLKSRKRVCAVCSAHASRMVIPSVSVSQRSRVIAFGVRKSQRPTYRERVRSNPPGTVRASGAKGHVLPFHRRPALPSIQAHRHEQDPNVGEHHIHRTHQEQSQEESLGKTTLLLVAIMSRPRFLQLRLRSRLPFSRYLRPAACAQSRSA